MWIEILKQVQHDKEILHFASLVLKDICDTEPVEVPSKHGYTIQKPKAFLIYETLSGDEIRDLILKDIKPTRSFKEDDLDDGKSSSALGSLGLKPKPAI